MILKGIPVGAPDLKSVLRLFICAGVGILELSVVLSVVSIVVIDPYTTDERVVVVKVHYKYKESFTETVRKLHTIFGQDNAPNESKIDFKIQRNWISVGLKKTSVDTRSFP